MHQSGFAGYGELNINGIACIIRGGKAEAAGIAGTGIYNGGTGGLCPAIGSNGPISITGKIPIEGDAAIVIDIADSRAAGIGDKRHRWIIHIIDNNMGRVSGLCAQAIGYGQIKMQVIIIHVYHGGGKTGLSNGIVIQCDRGTGGLCPQVADVGAIFCITGGRAIQSY